MQLSGVGPKVAACIALFSCDQHSSIPVDTHVWKLACKYYLPSVKEKTLTPKLHPMIMQVLLLSVVALAALAIPLCAMHLLQKKLPCIIFAVSSW
jgi:3-methyladenine DNA glycosylase/8-oxoguanine DNA glycosylase